ncbi:MAG: DUF2785 domain-containing protein [Usitatibacteraceae bacterium]
MTGSLAPRGYFLLSLGLIVALLAQKAIAQVSVPSVHDRAFWREIITQKYEVPTNNAIAPLALELSAFVTSADSELRDAFGYEILANWIHRSGRLSTADLDALRRAFLPHVLSGIGESGTDRVFARSFALLNLKELAAADLKTPFLSQASFDELFDLAAQALVSEVDLRGYVPEKGWAHATAHGADLLRVLARNPKLSRSQQMRLLDAFVTRLRSSKGVFIWGEDGRIAAALESLASRTDVDLTVFDSWFAALRAENQRLWREPFNGDAYVRVRTQVNTLAQFAALVARQNKPAFPAKLRDALHATLVTLD